VSRVQRFSLLLALIACWLVFAVEPTWRIQTLRCTSLNEWAHIRQARCDDTHGWLDARPYTGDIVASLGQINEGNQSNDVENESPCHH
jgi:hypothetical protein